MQFSFITVMNSEPLKMANVSIIKKKRNMSEKRTTLIKKACKLIQKGFSADFCKVCSYK